jgi:hypothetical protein
MSRLDPRFSKVRLSRSNDENALVLKAVKHDIVFLKEYKYWTKCSLWKWN